MKGKHCIFLLLILVALMSCNDPKPITDTLHRAEALMNEYPDSAWTILNTISPDEMGQNRNRAFMPCSIHRHKTRPIGMKPTIR